MLSKDRAREIVNTLINATKYQSRVLIFDSGENLTRFANSEIHQNVETENVLIILELYDGKKSASVNTNAIDEDDLKKAVADAEAMLQNAEEGEDEFIPTPKFDEIIQIDNDERLGKTFDIKGRAETLKRCFAALSEDFTAAGVISLNRNLRVYGDCVGNFHYRNTDAARFAATVIHKDGATGGGGVFARNLDNFNVDEEFKIAYDKAKASIGPVFADLGSYTVVLEPSAVADLLIYVAFGLNGDRYQKGLGFAAGKLGQKIFGENFTLRDDVNDPRLSQNKFDRVGYPTQPVMLIEKGVLKNVLHCPITAKKAGVEPTGHAGGGYGASGGGFPSNVILEGGNTPLADMIAGVERGILVSTFHYCNTVNPQTLQITGLTRDGTFMIEKGKIGAPVENMRFTESLLNAFSNITAMSEPKQIGFFGGLAMVPAMRIENFHFTSGKK